MVIAIVSPEDRIDGYRKMGVRHIWVVNPQTRRGFDCSTGSWIETQSFAVENSRIVLDLAEIFAELS